MIPDSFLFIIQIDYPLSKLFESGPAWWLTPISPALWEAKAGGSPEVGSSRPA